jgi:hypothetical protein
MLALTFARWLAQTQSEHDVEWVSFRGGDLLDSVLELGPATVLTEPDADWDHADPADHELNIVLERGRAVGTADVALAVSVAAGQVLPYLPSPSPPLVTWSVERGEDLHWVDGPIGLASHTTTWLAGSTGTRDEVRALLGQDVEVTLCPEFVEKVEIDSTGVERRRRTLRAPASPGLLVAGAGIATQRKAPDLFIELALAASRRHGPIDRFVWFGGQHDRMLASLIEEGRRLELDHVRFMGNVADVTPWLAAADVLAHPARMDAFPLVALHSALAGTPVVGFTDSGGLSEMFGSAVLGGRYPDIAALLDALDVLRDERAREQRAAEQRSAVAARFTAQAAAPMLLDHLVRTAHRDRTGLR